MSIQVISEAIRRRCVIRFYYTGETIPGYRIVEPHMVAYNEAQHLSLSGWLAAGVTASGGQGWREYLLVSISNISILESTFPGPRPGYNPTGGKKFHSIQAAI